MYIYLLNFSGQGTMHENSLQSFLLSALHRESEWSPCKKNIYRTFHKFLAIGYQAKYVDHCKIDLLKRIDDFHVTFSNCSAVVRLGLIAIILYHNLKSTRIYHDNS